MREVNDFRNLNKNSSFPMYLFISKIPMSVFWQMVDVRRTVTIPMEAITVHVQLVLSFMMDSSAEVRYRVCHDFKRIELAYPENYLTLLINLLQIIPGRYFNYTLL